MESGRERFLRRGGGSAPVEIALAAIGSRDDRHHGEAWDRIAAGPELVERYNELKRQCENASPGEYDVAKRAFFHENF